MGEGMITILNPSMGGYPPKEKKKGWGGKKNL